MIEKQHGTLVAHMKNEGIIEDVIRYYKYKRQTNRTLPL